MRVPQVVGIRTEGHKTPNTKAGYVISYNYTQPQSHFLTFSVLRRFLATYMAPPSMPLKFHSPNVIG